MSDRDVAPGRDLSPAPFRLGVTLHSFAAEYTSFVWSFEDLMRLAAAAGGGVEIVGPSHQRGFPYLTPEFEAAFKSSVERNGLTPTSYGSYADPFMLPGRDLSPEELVAYTIPQLEGAARLGFPIVRLQHFVAEVIQELLPWAEKLDLVLGYELHTPMTLESARTQFLMETVTTHDTPHLGIIPDAGIFGRSISQAHLEAGRRAGIGEDELAIAVEAWNAGRELEEALELLGSPDPKSRLTTWTGMVWDTFGHSEPAALREVIDRVVHVHGKFFTIVDGDEPDLRYRELVHTLVDLGYTGWISSEYEGDAPDSFAMVAAHQRMIRAHVASYRPA
ncbi:MAG: TIM barrel protein [Nocardioides sp.]|uniref:sugar phosphate isomerase/epimerase family protein n=1 Tax=Nocardioides sp. TaxID=35761 RepID=UPI0039E56EC8